VLPQLGARRSQGEPGGGAQAGGGSMEGMEGAGSPKQRGHRRRLRCQQQALGAAAREAAAEQGALHTGTRGLG
jgi:hypothetical protein